MVFIVHAFGHPNITAKHRTTFEITKASEISRRADCILGVKADKSVLDVEEAIKEKLKKGIKAKIKLHLPDYGIGDVVYGYGDPGLIFLHEHDIVVRKSKFVCSRTLAISATKAACDIKREIVELLKDKKTELIFSLEVEG